MADDETDADVTSREVQVTGAATPRNRRAAAGQEDSHVSDALRTVYQRAVEEDIPSEMLDLLSKLD